MNKQIEAIAFEAAITMAAERIERLEAQLEAAVVWTAKGSALPACWRSDTKQLLAWRNRPTPPKGEGE